MSKNTARSGSAAKPIPTGTARNLARHGNWSPNGGTPIVVAHGESLTMLSRRYGVPQKSLLHVNGLKSAAQVSPGTRLIVPVYDASGKISASSKSAAANKGGANKTVAKSEKKSVKSASKSTTRGTKSKPRLISMRKSHRQPAASPLPNSRPSGLGNKNAASRTKAIANGRESKADKRARLRKARLEADRKAGAKRTAAAAKTENNSNKVSKHVPTKKAGVDRSPTGSVSSRKIAEPAADGKFRWPARGRIIRGYKKGQNDGINIAVPEGASIKAAESGVVAYAGSELKGYGNLVLIRHSNGYVSAYAHNKQLQVKRGDRVNRGQTIAKAGRTGNVSTPQLHFELRKGAAPINPVKHLSGR